jgi:hypothetical protein
VNKEIAADWVRMRKAQPLERLVPASVRWLADLPVDVRPVELAAKYPRIVNLIAQQWHDYKPCCAYLDELLGGRRPERRGFPVDVCWEIWALRKFIRQRA